MANQSGTITSAQGRVTITGSPNDVITFTPTGATYTVEYPIGTSNISGATTTQTLTLSVNTQCVIWVASGSVAWSLVDNPDSTASVAGDGSTTFEDVSTTTYTVTTADFTGKTKRFTNASGCLVTVPQSLSQTAGKVVKWLQASGAGQITFQGDGTSTVTSASGDLSSSGELSSGYVEAQGSDSFLLVGQIGTPRIVQNSQSSAYQLVLSDAGKHLLHPSADTTARTFTIPANSTVAFPVGTVVTFVNQASAGTMTIAITTDTMRLAGAGTTGSRTLAANGIATAVKVTSTEWIISGTGLT